MPKSFRRALTNVSYSLAKLILIHCFDPKPLWFEIWSVLCPPGILLVRIPLAGASAKGKHYWKHLQEKLTEAFPPIVFATHSPCGWWGDCLVGLILKHRKNVIDFISRMHLKLFGVAPKIIGIHFGLKNMRVYVDIYDPLNLAETNPIIIQVVAAAKKFEDRVVREEELRPGVIEKVVIAKEVYGPPYGKGVLVAHQSFFLAGTIEIAVHLSGKEEIPVVPVDVFETANYQ